MSLIWKQIVEPKFLTAAQASYFTGPPGSKTAISQATICNTDIAAQTFSLHLVPPSGAATDENIIYRVKSVAPNETIILTSLIGQIVEAGSFISAGASIAAKVSLAIAGAIRT